MLTPRRLWFVCDQEAREVRTYTLTCIQKRQSESKNARSQVCSGLRQWGVVEMSAELIGRFGLSNSSEVTGGNHYRVAAAYEMVANLQIRKLWCKTVNSNAPWNDTYFLFSLPFHSNSDLIPCRLTTKPWGKLTWSNFEGFPENSWGEQKTWWRLNNVDVQRTPARLMTHWNHDILIITRSEWVRWKLERD